VASDSSGYHHYTESTPSPFRAAWIWRGDARAEGYLGPDPPVGRHSTCRNDRSQKVRGGYL